MMMIRVLSAALIAGLTPVAHAQVVGKPPLGDTTLSAARDKDPIEVVASGVGTSADIAAKEALRSAVEKAVGSVVSAETMVKNDRIISDTVLTYSDAFVEAWEKVGDPRKTTDGLVRVTIKARVRRVKLVARLEAAHITTTKVAGNDLFAESLTKVNVERDGKILMAQLFEGFPGNVLMAEAVGKPRIVKVGDTGTTIGVTVRFSIDQHKYALWGSRTKPLLAKLATHVRVLPWNPRTYCSPLGEKFFAEVWNLGTLLVPRERRKNDGWGALSIPQAEWGRCYVMRKSPDWLRNAQEKQHVLALVTSYVGETVTVYSFDEAIYSRLVDTALCSVPVVSVVLKDERGQEMGRSGPEVACYAQQAARFAASPTWIWQATSGNPEDAVDMILAGKDTPLDWRPGEWFFEKARKEQVLITPYMQAIGPYRQRVLVTSFCNEFEFEVTADQLKRITRVEVGMSSRNNVVAPESKTRTEK